MWEHWSEYGHGWGPYIGMMLFWLLLYCWKNLSGIPVFLQFANMLKEQYARGEIGRDEFTQKKRDLED